MPIRVQMQYKQCGHTNEFESPGVQDPAGEFCDKPRDTDGIVRGESPGMCPLCYTTYILGKDAVIGNYAEYLTVTTLAFNPVINEKLNSAGYRISFRAAANMLRVPEGLVKDDG